MFYELTVTIILDMLYRYINVIWVVRIVMFFVTNNEIFLNMFSFARRVELCLHIFFLTFLFDCYIDIIKSANILLNDWWTLCHQQFFTGKPYSIDNYEIANVSTCLTTY